MHGFHGFRGLGVVDPALVASLVQSGLTLTSSSVDLATAVQQRKAAEAAAKKKKQHAQAQQAAPLPVVAAPTAVAETSAAPYVLLGGVLILGTAFLVRRSSKQNAARSRG